MKTVFSILLSVTMALASCGQAKQDTNKCEKKCEQTCPAVKKDISLQLYSLRDDISKDYAGTIKKVGEMGFTSVEAANYNDGKFYGKTPAEFKADIEAAGMTVLSSHTGRGLSDEELKSGNLTEPLKWWDQCIQAHKEAGAKTIVIPSMSTPATIKDLQTYCDYYNEIGKRCNANGMMLGYHNHDFEFRQIEGQTMYDYMVENTNPEYVFFQMDVYWVVMGRKSPVDYFKKYPGRFKQLHVKDHKELGQSGMVGFDAIFKNTCTAGVKNLIIEVESYNFTPEESIKQSLDYLLRCPLVKESYN